MSFHAEDEVTREMECTRWYIGRCVVLRVQVGWFVGGGDECKLVVGESASALGGRRVCVEVV